MQKYDIRSLLKEWDFDAEPYIMAVRDIGDVCAIRYDDKKKPFRRDYERALLMLAVAFRYQSTKFLEFGTGRGFVCGCLSMLDHIPTIFTIDKLPHAKAYKLMSSYSKIDLEKISFLKANSLKIKDPVYSFGNSYDLVFIDGEHSAKAVKNDFEMSLKVTTEDAIIVFDDYRDKHAGVKKYIKKLKYDKILVSTDGWFYRNRRIEKHGDADKVVGGKEMKSGQVILYKGGIR